PGGNATGVNFLIAELGTKQLGLLVEMIPGLERVAVLVNPTESVRTETALRSVEAAAQTLRVQVRVVAASSSLEIDEGFAGLAREHVDALLVVPAPLYHARRVQLAILAAHYKIPTMYAVRDHVDTGGLMSYGTNLADMFRQVGNYTARILKGDKPSDLPVVQSDKFEFVLNMHTAKTLGLTVPPTLLARADEVIEGEGASSSRSLAAWRPPGRSRRARNSGRCRWSDFSTAHPPMDMQSLRAHSARA